MIRLVFYNLNTHRKASLYETLSGPGGPSHRQAAGVPPYSQARDLAESCPELVEGMAEIEFSVLARSCLRGRNPDEDSLESAANACVSERDIAGSHH